MDRWEQPLSARLATHATFSLVAAEVRIRSGSEGVSIPPFVPSWRTTPVLPRSDHDTVKSDARTQPH